MVCVDSTEEGGFHELTCMISRSWTYLRSVSTISRIIFVCGEPLGVLMTVETRVSFRDSVEPFSSRERGDGGDCSKASGGRWSTMAVTVLMT